MTRAGSSALAPHVAPGRNKEHVIAPEMCGVAAPAQHRDSNPEIRNQGGVIASVEPGSLAAEGGLQPGDALLAVNGYPVEDIIDVQFYSAEEHVELAVRRDTPEGAREFAVGGERE